MSTQGDKMTLKYPFDTLPIENFYSVAVWRGKSASLDFFVLFGKICLPTVKEQHVIPTLKRVEMKYSCMR